MGKLSNMLLSSILTAEAGKLTEGKPQIIHSSLQPKTNIFESLRAVPLKYISFKKNFSHPTFVDIDV